MPNLCKTLTLVETISTGMHAEPYHPTTRVAMGIFGAPSMTIGDELLGG